MTRGVTLLLLLTIVLGTVVWVEADYRIGFSINGYSSSNNTLANGSCCDGTCAAGSCRPTLRLCFRDVGHSHSDVESNCVSEVRRQNGANVVVPVGSEPVISRYYSREFQVYVRVSHRLEEDVSLADFDPPFTDPLIDDIFIEANVTAVSFDAQVNVVTETYIVTGDFGVATLTLALNARCAQNYFGSGCEMLCDSQGNNCDTVLTPPTTMPTEQPTEQSTSESTSESTSGSTSPIETGPTGSLADPTAPNVVGIAVGVAVSLAVLVCLGVVVVILIIYLVKKSKRGSWNPKRSSDPHFTLERAERNLTSNVNRISYISDNGDEVEYAVINKSPGRTPRRTPTPPPPYIPPMQTEELATEDEEDPTDTVQPLEFKKKETDGGAAGYEVMDFDDLESRKEKPNEPESELRYISLDIHKDSNGRAHHGQFSANAEDDDNHEPVQYSVVKHEDS